MKKFDGVLILSDMDGTLLTTDRRISQENRDAIAWFVENGGKFGLATGRSKPGMEYFVQDICVNAPSVIANGALIYDFEQKKALYTHNIGVDGYELTVDLIERFPEVGVEVALVDEELVAKDNEITRRHFVNVKIPYRFMPPEEIPQPWLKLNLTMAQPQIREMTAYIEKAYGGRFHAQHSADYFYEVLKPGATKGWGARWICQNLGVDPQKMYVVGDGQNDVELLQSSPNFYAPENAHPDILALNPVMLPHNDKHAIAALVEILDKKY